MKKVIPALFIFFIFCSRLNAQCNVGITTTNVYCYGTSTGTATLWYITPQLHFKWFNGDTLNATITGLPPGQVSANIYDSTYTLLCTVNDSITGPALMAPVIYVQGNLDTFCAYAPGILRVANGVNATSNFQWSNGVSGINLYQDSIFAPGLYTVTVTDTSCPANTATASASIIIAPRLQASYNGAFLNSCPGISVTEPVTISNGDLNYVFDIRQNNSTGGGYSSGPTQILGSYYPGAFTLTIHEANCLADSVVFSDSIGSLPAIYFTDNIQSATACGLCNGSVTVRPSGGTPPYTYNWLYVYNNYTTPSLQQMCTGIYNVQVTGELYISRDKENAFG